MSRVLITGGPGMLGAAVARRLLAYPAYDARIADARDAPQWMREACETRSPLSRRARQHGLQFTIVRSVCDVRTCPDGVCGGDDRASPASAGPWPS
jgi:nucleoside-diphosphate-sugar epimerase